MARRRNILFACIGTILFCASAFSDDSGSFGFSQSSSSSDRSFGEYASPDSKDVGERKVEKVCGRKPCTYDTNFDGREMTLQPPGIRNRKSVDVEKGYENASK